MPAGRGLLCPPARPPLPPHAARALATALRFVPRLSELQLRYNRLGDAGVAVLGGALPALPSLAHLALGGNGFGALGDRVLGAALSKAPGLLDVENEEDPPAEQAAAGGAFLPR